MATIADCSCCCFCWENFDTPIYCRLGLDISECLGPQKEAI